MDIGEVVRVVNLAYRVEDFFVNEDRVDATLITDLLERPLSGMFVMENDEPTAIVGAVHWQARNDQGTLGLLSVDPVWQGQGVGGLLVEKVMAHCAYLGCTSLQLQVVDLRAPMPKFYEGYGFRETGRRPFPDPEKLTRPAQMLVMTKVIGKFDEQEEVQGPSH